MEWKLALVAYIGLYLPCFYRPVMEWKPFRMQAAGLATGRFYRPVMEWKQVDEVAWGRVRD